MCDLCKLKEKNDLDHLVVFNSTIKVSLDKILPVTMKAVRVKRSLLILGGICFTCYIIVSFINRDDQIELFGHPRSISDLELSVNNLCK